MSEEVARMLVWSILGVALVVWMIGVRFVARVGRSDRAAEEADRLVFEPEESPTNQIAGQVTVEEGPLDLAKKLARALAQPQASQLRAVRVTRADDESVAFEQVENLDPQYPIRIRHGEVRFVADGPNRSVGFYRLSIDQGRGRLFAAAILLALGLMAIVVAAVTMEWFVITNPDPNVRWQALQSMQVAHLLWPPFTLAYTYRASRAAAVARIEAMLGNLPHLP